MMKTSPQNLQPEVLRRTQISLKRRKHHLGLSGLLAALTLFLLHTPLLTLLLLTLLVMGLHGLGLFVWRYTHHLQKVRRLL